jgi:hypothetical protein
MLENNYGHVQGGHLFESKHRSQEVPIDDGQLLDEYAPHPRCKLEEDLKQQQYRYTISGWEN